VCVSCLLCLGNYGLQDQQLALQFIKQYAAEFGGNINEITLEGYVYVNYNVIYAQRCEHTTPLCYTTTLTKCSLLLNL
jgi:hypothetical protein